MIPLISRKWLYAIPFVGMGIFMLLSFAHDGFNTERSIETYFLPLTVGFVTGCLISFFQYRIETKSRSYERQLSREREDAALGRAAATMAHEVRNLLNSVSMGTQRLQLEARELTPEHLHLLELMMDAVGRANRMVTDLLNYSRPRPLKPESVHLGNLIDSILMLHEGRCRDLGIRLEKHLNFPGTIQADPDLLKQVIENIVQNAIDAQPEGGFISLTLKSQNLQVALVVQNGGFEPPQDKLEMILEPYFTTKATGTGLGLAIVRRIVEAHGGHVALRAPAAKVLEMAVFLPLSRHPGQKSLLQQEDSKP